MQNKSFAKSMVAASALSVIYGLVLAEQGSTTSFNIGYSVGFAFGQVLKIFSLLGLVVLATRSINRIHRTSL